MSSSNVLVSAEVGEAVADSSDCRLVARLRGHLNQNVHFRHHGEAVKIDSCGGRVVLEGRLPSFYLKQVLQTTIRDLPGVRAIVNRVDVVSASGLSSSEKTDFLEAAQ